MPPHVITDSNFTDFINPTVDGERKSHGLVPRDYGRHPMGCFAWAEPFPDSELIPESDLKDAHAAYKAKGTLLDLRNAIKMDSLDQNGIGYCWAFSTTKAVMYCRAMMGDPLVVLSGWSVGCPVKNYRDEGGYGGESLDYTVTNGVSSLETWPKFGHYDNAASQANRVLHKIVSWWECDQNPEKAFHQIQSAAYKYGVPWVADFDWWSHSVCGCQVSPDDMDIDNSWTNSAGQNGIFNLTGSKRYPNGAWIPRGVTAAAA